MMHSQKHSEHVSKHNPQLIAPIINELPLLEVGFALKCLPVLGHLPCLISEVPPLLGCEISRNVRQGKEM